MSHTVGHSLSFLLSPKAQAVITLLGGFTGMVVGEYSAVLGAALVLTFLDFLTGYLVSLWEGNACSWKAGRGLIKKSAYFVVILSFYWAGQASGMTVFALYIRDAAATAIVLTEFTSILENLYNAGEGQGNLLPERVLKNVERVIDVRFAEITGREPMYKKLDRIHSQIDDEEQAERLRKVIEKQEKESKGF